MGEGRVSGVEPALTPDPSPNPIGRGESGEGEDSRMSMWIPPRRPERPSQRVTNLSENSFVRFIVFFVQLLTVKDAYDSRYRRHEFCRSKRQWTYGWGPGIHKTSRRVLRCYLVGDGDGHGRAGGPDASPHIPTRRCRLADLGSGDNPWCGWAGSLVPNKPSAHAVVGSCSSWYWLSCFLQK